MPRVSQRNRYHFFLIAIAMAVAFFIFRNPQLLTGIRTLTVKTVTFPVIATRSVSHYFSSKKKLYKENKALRRKLGNISLALAHYEEIKSENNRLRDLMGFKKAFDFKTIVCRVIARTPNDWTGTFIIDKGRASGIKVNTPICSTKGLVGKVVEIDKDISYVLPVTHFNFKAGGIILENRVNGVVVGYTKNRLKMLYIPIEDDVEEGSVVITSGLSRVFPKGIPIGKVVSVGKSETGLFQYAVIEPFADILVEEELLCVLEQDGAPGQGQGR